MKIKIHQYLYYVVKAVFRADVHKLWWYNPQANNFFSFLNGCEKKKRREEEEEGRLFNRGHI